MTIKERQTTEYPFLESLVWARDFFSAELHTASHFRALGYSQDQIGVYMAIFDYLNQPPTETVGESHGWELNKTVPEKPRLILQKMPDLPIFLTRAEYFHPAAMLRLDEARELFTDPKRLPHHLTAEVLFWASHSSFCLIDTEIYGNLDSLARLLSMFSGIMPRWHGADTGSLTHKLLTLARQDARIDSVYADNSERDLVMKIKVPWFNNATLYETWRRLKLVENGGQNYHLWGRSTNKPREALEALFERNKASASFDFSLQPV